MTVSIVAGEQSLESIDEVVFGSGARLDDCQAGGGVGHEHVAQAVAAGRTELADRPREVDDEAFARVDVDECRVHDAEC